MAVRRTTSLRLPQDLHVELVAAAAEQDTTLTALVERYATEGLAIDQHPGIVFRPGPSGRRAALAGGPDVWEIVAALQSVDGPDQERVEAVATELGLHPRQVMIALGYASEHADEIEERILANEAAWARAEKAHRARRRLLDRT